jgi:hypothetical protein
MQATGGPLQKGQTVLVTAAGGATGHMGAQLALLAGCHVVATCGSARKAERLRALGIHRVINHSEEVLSNHLDLPRLEYACLTPSNLHIRTCKLGYHPDAAGCSVNRVCTNDMGYSLRACCAAGCERGVNEGVSPDDRCGI